MFLRKPTTKEWVFLIFVIILYFSAIVYVVVEKLDLAHLFKCGVLAKICPEKGCPEEIKIPLSWNIPQIIGLVYIKGAAILVNLFLYWIIGMLIGGLLIATIPWEKIRAKMGYGKWWANLFAMVAGGVSPLCSCAVVPVVAAMIRAGLPLAPCMVFLIAGPMINVSAVFITASVLGWTLAIGRIIGTVIISLSLGHIVLMWQKKVRFLTRFVRFSVGSRLPSHLESFAISASKLLAESKDGLPAESFESISNQPEHELMCLAEAGIVDRKKDGRWYLIEPYQPANNEEQSVCQCEHNHNPTGLKHFLMHFTGASWELFLRMNYYLVLGSILAGILKVFVPTDVVQKFIGGNNPWSVFIAAAVALPMYICTYAEIPTAQALLQMGARQGPLLSYLLLGPAISIPGILLLSGVFKPRVLVVYIIVSFVICVAMGNIFNLLGI